MSFNKIKLNYKNIIKHYNRRKKKKFKIIFIGKYINKYYFKFKIIKYLKFFTILFTCKYYYKFINKFRILYYYYFTFLYNKYFLYRSLFKFFKKFNYDKINNYLLYKTCINLNKFFILSNKIILYTTI